MIPFLVYLSLAWIWGGSFVAIKFVVQDFPPSIAAAFRVGLAAVFLSGFLLFKKKSFKIPRDLFSKVLLVGFFLQGVPFALLFWGEAKISAGLAAILNGTTPIWTFLLGLFFFRGNASWQKAVGILIGFVGVYFVFSSRLGNHSPEFLRALAVLGMAASYGIGIVLSRHFFGGRKDLDLFTNLVWQHVFGALFLIGVSFLLKSDWSAVERAELPAWLGVFYLAIFANALGWPLFFYLTNQWDTLRASTVTYLVPLCAVFMDWLFLSSLLERHEIVGATLILSGVVLVQFRFFGSPRRPA